MDTGNIMENQLQDMYDGYDYEQKIEAIKESLREEFEQKEGISHNQVFVSYSQWLENKIVDLKLQQTEWTQERVQKAFYELGFDFPETPDELKAFDEKFKDYPYKADATKIDPLKILNDIKNEDTKRN